MLRVAFICVSKLWTARPQGIKIPGCGKADSQHPQLHCKMPEIPSERDPVALAHGILGSAGESWNIGGLFGIGGPRSGSVDASVRLRAAR